MRRLTARSRARTAAVSFGVTARASWRSSPRRSASASDEPAPRGGECRGDVACVLGAGAHVGELREVGERRLEPRRRGSAGRGSPPLRLPSPDGDARAEHEAAVAVGDPDRAVRHVLDPVARRGERQRGAALHLAVARPGGDVAAGRRRRGDAAGGALSPRGCRRPPAAARARSLPTPSAAGLAASRSHRRRRPSRAPRT